MLRIRKKSIHTPILLRHLDVSRKKNQTQNTEPEIIDCAPTENGSKKTRTLELELPNNYPKTPKPLQ